MILSLKGLTCANCAGKIETAITKMDEAELADINLVKQVMEVKLKNSDAPANTHTIFEKIEKIVHKYEPDVEVSLLDGQEHYHDECNCGHENHKHHLDECGCGYEHEHSECNIPPHERIHSSSTMKLRLDGLTCANCAGKIEAAVSELSEASYGEINLVNQTMEVGLSDAVQAQAVFEKIENIVRKYEPDVRVSLLEEKTASKNAAAKTDDDEKKIPIARFVLGIIAFICAALLSLSLAKTLCYLAAYAIFGYDVLLRAVKNISRGQVFDENFLMSLSTIGAIAIGEMPEAVFVMLFYQIGEAFQDYAVARSRKSITALLDIRPDHAIVITENGEREVSPEDVRIGDLILVKAGERIPLDGVIEDGSALLDTVALTGEALPMQAEKGSTVLSGCINTDGTLRIRVTKTFGDSTVMKILEMVENAAGKKSKTERFITRFARIYTPTVVVLAVALALIPTLLGMGEFSLWLGRALIFLVVSCPCALVLSVPLSYFAGIGAASKNGILVKGGEDIDTLCHLDQLVFDKTGTLTKGEFSVTEIIAEDKENTLLLAAMGEAESNHPIGKAIIKEYNNKSGKTLDKVANYKELGGHGIAYTLNGNEVLLGNHRLMEGANVDFAPYEGMGSVVYIAKGGIYQGCIVVADSIKEGCKNALASLRKQGVSSMTMLTGDREENAAAMAKELGIDRYYSQLLPQDKVHILEGLMKENTSGKTGFVGDGVNDAPVLARADIGIAMGGIGSDAAIEAADVVLMEDDISKLSVGIRIAKNTRKIANQNIVFSLVIKVAVLVLTVFGMATMWAAVFADVGVAFLAILNAMRKK